MIDVPGHERFVRTMVAGATGIDLFLLVIDAGEGARPQTHEHLAILRLLGIEHGVVALTKVDAVDEEAIELAEAEAVELVPGVEVVRVSARTGEGLDELRAALARVADSVEHERADRPTRLYVDRSFSVPGFGTVVTGTLWSGSIGAGDQLRLEPSGRDIRVRSVQVHDRDVGRAEAGQRVAVSLPGIDRRDVARGEALIEPGGYPTSYRLDVALEEIAPIEDDARVQVHLGTTHTPARVVRLGERFAQLRLASPVIAARGDRLILRGETTLGGGNVLDPMPPRHRDVARVERLAQGDVAGTIHAPVLADTLRFVLDGELAEVERAGPWVFSAAWLAAYEADLRERIAVADPIDPGVPVPADAWADDVLALLPLERRGSKLFLPGRSRRWRGEKPSPPRSSASSRAQVSTRRRCRTTRSPASSKRVGGSFGSATATRSASTRSTWRRTFCSRSVEPPARSRWPASVTSWERDAETRSSSSSASTPTGSRVASVMCACCDESPGGRH